MIFKNPFEKFQKMSKKENILLISKITEEANINIEYLIASADQPAD